MYLNSLSLLCISTPKKSHQIYMFHMNLINLGVLIHKGDSPENKRHIKVFIQNVSITEP